MLQSSLQQTDSLWPLLHAHVGLSEVETAEGLEGEGERCYLFLVGQVLGVEEVRHVIHMLRGMRGWKCMCAEDGCLVGGLCSVHVEKIIFWVTSRLKYVPFLCAKSRTATII